MQNVYEKIGVDFKTYVTTVNYDGVAIDD